MTSPHSFHIPVMGIGFTIDTPIKVAHLGIDSVVSLVDDHLMEKLRQKFCKEFQFDYEIIKKTEEDSRERRVTAYLNLLNDIVKKQREAMFDEGRYEEYINLLPEDSELRNEYNRLRSDGKNPVELRQWANENLQSGSIDVNIMTKVDRPRFKKGKSLGSEMGDAHTALKGFAKSNLSSSLVLSAGMNPRLYGYIAEFEDFFPDAEGRLKKRVVLKVSDYRSAMIQGKFMAKKGIWVSEYRIESGLNCGGHAFATEGLLMGPILEEFAKNRDRLKESTFEVLTKALATEGRNIPEDLELRITAQGGIGTSGEHDFLLTNYQIDSVGWGSPFLLVPEATTVDKSTLAKLKMAKESDLYLSNISPLGVPFNSLRGNTKDLEKMSRITSGKAGSTCPKQYLALNNESPGNPICTASRQYQKKKLQDLDDDNLPVSEYLKQFESITQKSCICVGLGTSALLVHGLDTRTEGNGVSVCPGPNMAYFNQELTLKRMIDHIYGRIDVAAVERPHVFVKELNIYIEYLTDKLAEASQDLSSREIKYFDQFASNLASAIDYYMNLPFADDWRDELKQSESSLGRVVADLEKITTEAVNLV